MILAVNIMAHDLPYVNDIRDCLMHNSSISQIEKIVVFSEFDLKGIDIDPRSKNIKWMKMKIDHYDAIKYACRLSRNSVIYSTPFVKFDSNISRMADSNPGTIYRSVDSYYIFHKGTKIEKRSSIDDILIGTIRDSKLLFKKSGYFSMVGVSIPSLGWKKSKLIEEAEEETIPIPISISDEDSNILPAANRIDVVIISVDYNDFLEITLERNRRIFDHITVVTSPSDNRCVEICEANGVNVVVTDSMYSDGAKFNKGKAINDGLNSISDPDVVLLMDADIIVQDFAGLSDIEEDCIYYRDRIMLRDYDSYDRFTNLHIYNQNSYLFEKNGASGFEVESIGPVGYFQLFKYNRRAHYPESFTDASWSDVRFANKFRRKFKIDTPVLHLGESRKNWSGRVTSEFKEKKGRGKNIENLTILYPPTINWDLLFQRPQQIMKNFSKIEGVTSIYWNSAGDKKQSNAIESPSSKLYIVDQFKKIDEFGFLFNGKKILWFSHPSHHYLSRIIKWDLVVFDAIDNPVDEFSEWSIDLSNAVRESDIIFASAKVMYDDHKKTGKPVYMLPNGSDFELFEKSKNKLDRPSDFPDVEGPIIGYYGAMATWLDWEIVKKLSTKYKIVMIGGNKYYNERIDSENIYYLDHKKIEELPYYLSNFDIPIIPFKLTEMIKGCDPIKFYEYIASGKPVVVTEMLELKRFKDICYFMNYENCIEVIEKALHENNSRLRNKRIEVSKKNSWELRAKAAIDLIKKHLRDV